MKTNWSTLLGEKLQESNENYISENIISILQSYFYKSSFINSSTHLGTSDSLHALTEKDACAWFCLKICTVCSIASLPALVLWVCTAVLVRLSGCAVKPVARWTWTCEDVTWCGGEYSTCIYPVNKVLGENFEKILPSVWGLQVKKTCANPTKWQSSKWRVLWFFSFWLGSLTTPMLKVRQVSCIISNSIIWTIKGNICTFQLGCELENKSNFPRGHQIV